MSLNVTDAENQFVHNELGQLNQTQLSTQHNPLLYSNEVAHNHGMTMTPNFITTSSLYSNLNDPITPNGNSIYSSYQQTNQQTRQTPTRTNNPHSYTLKRSQTLNINNQTKYDTLTRNKRNSFINNSNNITNYLNENDENQDLNLVNPAISSPASSTPPAVYYNSNSNSKDYQNSFKENVYTLKRPVNLSLNTNTSLKTTSDTLRRSASFRNNENMISDILKNQTNKPVPPNRTSSLQYKNQSDFKQQQAALKNSTISYRTNNDDRNSIYSSFSLRLSNSNYLSSLNFENNGKTNQIIKSNDLASPFETDYMNCNLLNKNETNKIESCYQSIGSNVFSSKCLAGLYFTNLQNLINLNDWKLHLNAVPVWVFNTGLNPKRPKGLTLVMADKKTGFALWKSNPITYINDVKWTRPGHITFKFSINNQNTNNQNSKKKTSKKNSNKSRPLSLSLTTANLYAPETIGTIRTSSSANNIKYNDLVVNSNNDTNSTNSYVFAAIKFDDEFECSKFFDFYRTLFVDTENDDLFNPHYKPNLKPNIIKVFYKKITKNSISSPVAFNHINSLSVVLEEPTNNYGLNSSHDLSNSNSSDTQSMMSELTVTSHNNSSIITHKRNKV